MRFHHTAGLLDCMQRHSQLTILNVSALASANYNDKITTIQAHHRRRQIPITRPILQLLYRTRDVGHTALFRFVGHAFDIWRDIEHCREYSFTESAFVENAG